jgi:predicted unusual protein kinase regulating ubiquinone biosynthesis (AarF/ABC1/UbiB family)
MWGHLCTWFGLTSRVLGYYLWYYLAGYRATFYERTLRLLRNHNILFTKIFQSLANSPSLELGPDLRTQLAVYNATVGYTENEIDNDTIDSVEATYDIRLDRRPINSGMIALVFQGTRTSGEPVILKLKRRGIDAQLRSGCESVRFIYSLAAYWSPRNLYVRVLRPFIRNIGDIIEQCDFGHEIQNMVDAKHDYTELDYLQIPTVYNREEHRSSAPFILMERIQGVHVLPADTSEEVRLEYLRKFCLFTSFCYVSNAIQHLDLHAGNVLYTPTGLGIIDFGMALRVADDLHDIMLTAMEVIRHPEEFERIDVLEEARNFFDPPLSLDTIQNAPAVRAIIRAISRPLRDNIMLDELNITDQLDQLSVELGREVVLHRDFYKIMLGMSMMGCVLPIMSPAHYNPQQLIEVQRECIERAFLMVM